MRLRPASDFPTSAFRIVLPLTLGGVIPVWMLSLGLEKGWLFLVATLAATVVGLPLLMRVRSVVGFAFYSAILASVATAVGWAVWAQFVHLE